MINGTTLSPAATPNNASRDDILFHRRSTIPSFVKTLDFAYRKFGSSNISWEEALNPAINYAENGFELGDFRAKVYQLNEQNLFSSPYNMEHFLINGKIPQKGEFIKQPVLAATLHRLAKAGANDFYNGQIAKIIALDMSENKGWISLEDLNNFPEPRISPALSTNYRNYTVFTSTPPCGGWVVLLALNLLEQMPVSSPGFERNKDLIIALTLAHGERQVNPVTEMVNYEEEVAEKLTNEKAIDLINSSPLVNNKTELTGSGETTHFSIVDSDGMLVSVTTSINAFFGSRAASKELGFIYNSYMEDFVFGDSTHSFAVGPNKMAYSSMSPSIIRDNNNQNVMALGSPGSARIISSVAQTIQYWIDIDKDISSAVNQPRVHIVNKKAYLEAEPTRHMLEWLAAQGYSLAKLKSDLTTNNRNPYFGGIHAVAFENGQWVGAADPRRDGTTSSEMPK
jgi:gamma-glutamyltranspeptidase/glutathione hydrolase